MPLLPEPMERGIELPKKPQMPVPEVVAAEMTRIVRTASELADLAQHVGDAYADLYDAAYRKTGNGDGSNVNRPGAPLGDPTGDVATSGMHKRMRGQVQKAATLLLRDQFCHHCQKVHIRGVPELLEQAAQTLLRAWLAQDPNERERLHRLRELERELATSKPA